MCSLWKKVCSFRNSQFLQSCIGQEWDRNQSGDEPKSREETAMAELEDESWRKETIPKIVKILCTNPSSSKSLSQRGLYSLLLISPWCYHTLLSQPSLWQVPHQSNPSTSKSIINSNLDLFYIILFVAGHRSSRDEQRRTASNLCSFFGISFLCSLIFCNY